MSMSVSSAASTSKVRQTCTTALPVLTMVHVGRGKGTHAYMHSLENSHHVFMNLHTLKVGCHVSATVF